MAVPKNLRLLIDLASGLLMPYAALAGFIVIFKSDFEPDRVMMGSVLPILLLIFPFATLSYNPIGVVVILALAGAFYSVFRYVPPAYRPYATGLTFFGWGLYGLYCTRWIAA